MNNIYAATVTVSQLAKVKELDARFKKAEPTELYHGYDSITVVPDGTETQMIMAQWGTSCPITIGILSDGSSHS